MLLSVPAPAAIVTTTADSGPGSLRDAISNAAPGETITFSGVGTITLTSGELLIDKDLIISGPGPGSLVIQRSTASGTPDFRIFHASSANVIISGLTVSNGRDDFGGGGIYNDFDLTLNDCDVTGNFAAAGGGMENDGAMAISNCVFWGNTAYDAGDGLGGGIYNFGTLDAVNCLISSNSVTSVTGNGFGGGIENAGTLTLTSCIINGNSATGSTNGGAGFGGGMDNEFGTLYALTSTVSGNVAQGGAGNAGGLAEGAGVANGFGTLTLDHSTVSGNSAVGGAGNSGGWSEGGGIANDVGTVYVDSSTVSGNVSSPGSGTSGTNGSPYGGGIFNGFGSVIVTYSTIAYNAVPGGFPNDGGGIYNYGGGVELDSTIVAANTATVDLVNDLTGSGFTVSDGFNVIGSTSGLIFTGLEDQTGVTAAQLNLGPLQNNGGPTFTHALLCGSVALNAGDITNAPATDQRGFPRIVNGTIDAGAYEAGINCPALVLVKTAFPTNPASGEPVTYYYAVTNVGSVTITNINILDDNGTPGDTSDDFYVNGAPFSLAAGQGTVFAITHISEPMCISNGGTNLNAGTLTINVLTNGNVEVFYMQSQSLNDNRYGTNATAATGWPGGHKFNDLKDGDQAEFRFTDGNGKVVLDFLSDYISPAPNAKFGDGVTILYPSGFGTQGPLGGDGKMITGKMENVLSVHTTLSDTLNQPGFTGYTANSPKETSPLSGVSVPAGWNYVYGYHVIASSKAFGAAGIGSVTVALVKNTPSKLKLDHITPTNACGCVVNTAVAVAYQGTALLAAAFDNATVCFTSGAPCDIAEGTVSLGCPAPQLAGCPTAKQLQLPLQNNGTADIFMTELDLAWPSANGALTQVSLNGAAAVWKGSATSPVTLTTADFDATSHDTNHRKLPGGPAGGQAQILTLTFKNNVSTDPYIYSGVVKFGTDSSCAIAFLPPPPPPCIALGKCTPPYPFTSTNPLTSIAFNESGVLRSSIVTVVPGTSNCVADHIALFYNDEHAMSLGVRQVIVKTRSGTTTTNYPFSPLLTNPESIVSPLVGSTIATGDQAGVDVSGRPLFPALFITDLTTSSNPYGGDWQYGGTPIPPTEVYGTWKGFVKTVDKTTATPTVTVDGDNDPPQNNWNLGTGSDPAPSGLRNEGYGAEARWDVSRLGLVSGHTYRLYFMVHDGDQNKTGGDVGQTCATMTVP